MIFFSYFQAITHSEGLFFNQPADFKAILQGQMLSRLYIFTATYHKFKVIFKNKYVWG